MTWLVIIYVYVHICCCWWEYIFMCICCCWWVYIFMCIYVVGDYICDVHICCWWLYMWCAYMLLVNFLTCYWCWIVGVSMYWNMLVWICWSRMKYVLLLSSHRSTHSCCWISSPCLVANTFVFNYAGCLCGVIMMFSWHQGWQPRRWFGTTHVYSWSKHFACFRVSHICLCVRGELFVGAFVCLVIICNWRILYLNKYCWW